MTLTDDEVSVLRVSSAFEDLQKSRIDNLKPPIDRVVA